jgi:hypothetical protein
VQMASQSQAKALRLALTGEKLDFVITKISPVIHTKGKYLSHCLTSIC